ncbi:MAG: MFS transporter [Alphaproteobacteria bacterium]|nr:MFS transporter [Alphaproteobacteria bacterium]OJV12024.1 MAG: hypothetical protein BGO27_00345 [Alphaproteobacteria bacterium 33-17]
MTILQSQPKAFRLIALIQICESFSYYGMRAILILFLMKSFLASDSKAYAISAVFVTLVEFIRLIGGVAADKALGLRYSIILGTIIISSGHILMSCSDFIYLSENTLFYIGLGMIVLGSGLFKANCASLLGEFYQKDDPRRQSGYTLYYTCINIGALLSTILCGIVSEVYGYKYGFSLAAIGMCIANIFLYIMNGYLEDKGRLQNFRISKAIKVFCLYLLLLPVIIYAVINAEQSLNILPIIMGIALCIISLNFRNLCKEEIKNIGIIALAVILMALFYSIELQMGSTLIIYAENFVERQIMGYTIPSSVVNAINPLSIIFLGSIVAKILSRRSCGLISSFKNIGYAFTIVGLGFIALSSVGIINPETKLSLIAFLPIFALIGASELLVGPAIYALSSRLAPSNLKGSVMGLVMFGYSLAGIISGFTSKMFVFKTTPTIKDFSNNYSLIGFTLLLIAFAIIGVTTIKQSKNAKLAY